MLSNGQLAAYRHDGFVIVEHLFDAEEAKLLLEIATADKALAEQAEAVQVNDLDKKKDARVVAQGDGSGRETKFWVDDELRDDTYSAVARSRRVVEPIEQMLKGEAYHWHHKMMLKAARVGGAHMWHQDFGYWHKSGHVLFPHMASCMIAVNRTMKSNGCLQVLAGSHEIGLIEHVRVEGQATADPDRIEPATERLDLVYLELEPGSAVFFHSNLLHRSEANQSNDPRWTLICCYNAAQNEPYRESHHPRYRPLNKLDDDQVRIVGRRQLQQFQQSA